MSTTTGKFDDVRASNFVDDVRCALSRCVGLQRLTCLSSHHTHMTHPLYMSSHRPGCTLLAGCHLHAHRTERR